MIKILTIIDNNLNDLDIIKIKKFNLLILNIFENLYFSNFLFILLLFNLYLLLLLFNLFILFILLKSTQV